MSRTPMLVLGIILVVLGAAALIWQKISYSERELLIDVGPVKVTADQRKDVPLSPIIGGLMLAGGAVLIVVGARSHNQNRTGEQS